MKYQIDEDEDDNLVRFEKFTNRKRRQRPSDSNHAYARRVSASGEVKYEEPGLQFLYEEQYITEVLRMVRRGKEATVYLCRGKSNELLAAKVYTDLKVRSFRNDTIYRDGRFIGSKRMEKAIEQHTRTGVDAHQALWIAEEYRQLKFLYEASVPVPKPIISSGRVILMEFIGDEVREAPRLSEADLPEHLVVKAFRQSVENLKRIVEAGRIHGDYSTFNLLWWKSRVVVIDFPQVVEIQRSQHAWDLLRRDVESLCHSFARLGIQSESEVLFREVERHADWRK